MKQETLKEKAYKYIKDKIISCEYAPGDFLDEKILIEEIHSSRTPIREALNKIEQENLIKIIPKKGVVVTKISEKNILDIYQFRKLVEPNAILEYGPLYDKKSLLEFRKFFINNSLKQIDFYNKDDKFHAYIVDKYKNDYISSIMEDVRLQNQRLRILTGKFNDFSLARMEHIEIIDNLLNKNYSGAYESMKKHIDLSKDRAMEVYENYL